MIRLDLGGCWDYNNQLNGQYPLDTLSNLQTLHLKDNQRTGYLEIGCENNLTHLKNLTV